MSGFLSTVAKSSDQEICTATPSTTAPYENKLVDMNDKELANLSP